MVVDDMVDTAGTLCLAAKALKDEGAAKVEPISRTPCCLARGPRVSKSALDELVVTDTIPLSEAARESGSIRQIPVAGLLAETIRRIRDEESVSSLYID